MSIPYSGRIGFGGYWGAISKQLKVLSLKPVKKVVFKFDPFLAEAKETRDFMFQLATPKIRNTNLGCVFKTSIDCDRSEPTVTFNLANGSSVLFKCNNLTTVEMLQLYNKHITSLVPKEDPTEVVQTKSEKKSAKRKTTQKK